MVTALAAGPLDQSAQCQILFLLAWRGIGRFMNMNSVRSRPMPAAPASITWSISIGNSTLACRLIGDAVAGDRRLAVEPAQCELFLLRVRRGAAGIPAEPKSGRDG